MMNIKLPVTELERMECNVQTSQWFDEFADILGPDANWSVGIEYGFWYISLDDRCLAPVRLERLTGFLLKYA